MAYRNYDLPSPSKKVKRAPLRTITELAEEFGLTRQELVGQLAHTSVPHPRPVMMHKRRHSNPGNTWYEPGPMRAWWKAHCAEKEKSNGSDQEKHRAPAAAA